MLHSQQGNLFRLQESTSQQFQMVDKKKEDSCVFFEPYLAQLNDEEERFDKNQNENEISNGSLSFGTKTQSQINSNSSNISSSNSSNGKIIIDCRNQDSIREEDSQNANTLTLNQDNKIISLQSSFTPFNLNGNNHDITISGKAIHADGNVLQHNKSIKEYSQQHQQVKISSSLNSISINKSVNNSYSNQKHKNKSRYMIQIQTNKLQQVSNIRNQLFNFYRKYTYYGKQYNLNEERVRKILNDKSDGNLCQNGESSSKISRMKQQFIEEITSFMIKLPLLNPQKNSIIFLEFVFIVLNSIFFFLLSVSLVFNESSILSSRIQEITFVIWITEVVLKLNTAVFTQTNYIDNRREVILIYLKNRFMCDIIPIILVKQQFNSPIIDFISRAILLLRLINTFRDKAELDKQLLVILRQYYLIQLFNLIFKLFLVGHLIACLWYFVAIIDQNMLGTPHNQNKIQRIPYKISSNE